MKDRDGEEITPEEFEKIVEANRRHRAGEAGGKRAALWGADLRGANLNGRGQWRPPRLRFQRAQHWPVLCRSVAGELLRRRRLPRAAMVPRGRRDERVREP